MVWVKGKKKKVNFQNKKYEIREKIVVKIQCARRF